MQKILVSIRYKEIFLNACYKYKNIEILTFICVFPPCIVNGIDMVNLSRNNTYNIKYK